MNDSLDTWLAKQPHWYSVPFYSGLAKARGDTAEECSRKGDMAGASRNAEAAQYYARAAKTIGAFLRDAA